MVLIISDGSEELLMIMMVDKDELHINCDMPMMMMIDVDVPTIGVNRSRAAPGGELFGLSRQQTGTCY